MQRKVNQRGMSDKLVPSAIRTGSLSRVYDLPKKFFLPLELVAVDSSGSIFSFVISEIKSDRVVENGNNKRQEKINI